MIRAEQGRCGACLRNAAQATGKLRNPTGEAVQEAAYDASSTLRSPPCPELESLDSEAERIYFHSVKPAPLRP